ncbi:MAG: cation:proton antiporter [Desulfovibrionaceae bacterium]|nr:cation:proton antiporter [Desulfovibrionaceae bacterium]
MNSILTDIVVLFLLSIGVTLFCNKLRLPVTVGFLLTGVLCGPTALGVVSDVETIEQIADIGVAILLFTIGMELSGEALSRLRRPVFLGGTLQIGLTILVVTACSVFFKILPWQKGVFWGCLMALSSSAIVLRIMQSKGMTSTPAGRLSLAILVFQDIMVAPMLLGLPMLQGQVQLTWLQILTSVGEVAVILGIVLLVAYFGLNRLMEAVVRTRTREILLATTVGLCMGMALLTQSLGLSLSLGAFLAGLMLARSQYSMSVISGILPYRDIFMSLFFISVGMMLDLNFCLHNLATILILTLAFIVLKTVITMPSVLVQGYPLKVAIIVSLCLAQVGEFAFVLAKQGVAGNFFPASAYQMFLAISVISMMLTPALIAVAPKFSEKVTQRFQKDEFKAEEPEAQDALSQLEDHLIIIGFGISGKHLASVAKQSHIPYAILEMNPETVEKNRKTELILHGDASEPMVLKSLGILKARIMAIVISDPAAVRAITLAAHSLNPKLYIVARTRFVTEIAPLRRMGANAVISEEFESSIEVFSNVLTQYLIPRQDIDAYAAKIRTKNYRMIRRLTYTEPAKFSELMQHIPDISLQAVRVEKNSPMEGLSLANSQLRPKYGVTVVAIARHKKITASLDPKMIFEANDILYLFANKDKLYAIVPLFKEKKLEAKLQEA